MKNKRWLLSLIMVAIIATGCTGCSVKNQEKRLSALGSTTDNKKVNTLGNTNGNLANEGKVASQGNWIYFGAKDGLYKSKADGSQKQKLCEGYKGSSVYWINVVDDWVYFASIGLYKVKTDGSNYQQIDSQDLRGVHVIGDWIYYGSEYKMKTDGFGKEKLDTRNAAAGYTINIVDDWIYFFDKDKENNNGIFKMKTDGSNKQKILSGRADYMIVDGNWIYYVNYKDNSLYKMSLDGTDNELLLKGNISNLNIVDDWIYYNGDYNDKPSLCKIKTNGSDNQLICHDNAVNINIIDGWIYYEIKDDNFNTIYKIKIDGSDKQVFFKGTDITEDKNVKKEQDMSEEEIMKQLDESVKRSEEKALLEESGQDGTKEYNALSLSKNNIDSSSKPKGAWVYKLKIENNNLIVWGSLDCNSQGSSQIKHLKDQKRIFKLSDNVDLGLDWVGNEDKQIKYFNDNGQNMNSEAFFFRTIKGKVTYLTFAG